jgi:hypothetical protein
MANKFSGYCVECGARVGAGEGTVARVGGKWAVTCAACNTGREPTGYSRDQGHGAACDCNDCLEGRSAQDYEYKMYGRD